MKREVETADGGCSSPKIVATIKSGTLDVKFRKPNHHLIGDFNVPNHTASVAPSAKYVLNWKQ